MSPTAHPMIDAAVLAAIAEMPEVEIDWRAEYSRLYKAWKAAKDRLAQLENRHYFCEVVKQMAKAIGRDVEMVVRVEDNGSESFTAWVGAVHTPPFKTVEDLESHLYKVYCITDEADLQEAMQDG